MSETTGPCPVFETDQPENRLREKVTGAATAEPPLGSSCKRQQADENASCKRQQADDRVTLCDEHTNPDAVISAQALIDAIVEPGILQLKAYADLSSLRGLAADTALFALRAHTELLLTSSLSGCSNPFPSESVVPAPPAVVQGLILICQEIVATTAGALDAISARRKLMVFGWLLAGLMGQEERWHPDVAIKVGKRLERSLDPVRASLAEQTAALMEALRSDDHNAVALAQATMRRVLSAPTHSAIAELTLPSGQAPMESAALALLAAADGGASGVAGGGEPSVDVYEVVLGIIPGLTQDELWQVVERAQRELKARSEPPT